MAKLSNLVASESLYYSLPEFIVGESRGAVRHGFFGRCGGVSKGVYASLNCGPGSQDEDQDVIDNRAIVAEAIGCAPENLLSLHQVHGAECLVVDGAESWSGGDERPQADAFVTDQAGIGLGILTADCAPVLFYGEKSDGAPVIGAAHAGWGGAFKGVLGSTVARMVELGAVQGSIRACIGPCIGWESYEVGQEFYERFLSADEENARFFKNATQDGHYMFSLAGYAAHRLRLAGVEKVAVQGIDTYFNEEDFFSYRRATHRMERDYGRQISVIMIG